MRHADRRNLVGLGIVTVAIIGALLHQSGASSGASVDDLLRGDLGGLITEDDGVVDEADGVLPDGVTVFDDSYAGVANLDPELLGTLRRAATDAAAEGVVIQVNSGWRSSAYQDQLLRQAVDEYGSEAEAARWVAPADRSLHVAGEAVDVGPADATAWLSARGAAYGLCRVYDNEPWHYELRPGAPAQGCPRRWADPTQDPRTQP